MKRSAELEPLSHDHFEGLLVAARIRKGIDKQAPIAEVAAYTRHFWDAHLERHFEQEETVLIPLLTQIDRPDLTERMLREHRRIQDLIESACGEHDEQGFSTLSHLMTTHIRFEERELFPALEANLSNSDLQEAGRQLRKAHEEADLSWEPAFWE